MSGELKIRGTAQRHQPVLSDLQRLPVEAAVDMLVATLETDAALLDFTLAERLQTDVQDVTRRSALSLRLLEAWDRRTTTSELQLAEIGRLAPLVTAHIDTTVGALALVGRSQGPCGVALIEPMLRASRLDTSVRAALCERLETVAAEASRPWREVGDMGPLDVLSSGWVEQWLAAKQCQAALRVAVLWPPGRSALVNLAATLAGLDDVQGLSRLLSRLDSRGTLASAAAQAAAQVAKSKGPAGESVAWWCFARRVDSESFSLLQACTSSLNWPRRVTGAITATLDLGEAVWLVELSSEQRDPAQFLQLLVDLAERRPRTERSALEALADLDPVKGYRAGCGVLLRLLHRDDGVSGAQTVKRCVRFVRACAQRSGQRQMCEQWLELVRRELGQDTPTLRGLT